MGAKHPARNPAKYLASCPRNVPAMAGQWQRNAAERPSRRLARQLALRRTWTRNVRAGNLRDNSQYVRATAVPQPRNGQGNISQAARGIPPSAFNHDIQKL
jgi:hypothetical protein